MAEASDSPETHNSGVKPSGWTYLAEIGEAHIFSAVPSPSAGPVPQIWARTRKDVGILEKEIDIELSPTTTLSWQWIVQKLPSQLAEDIASTHDYFSIAVKFDNGQDLTYIWSVSLPHEHGFRCPLKNWALRETHVVIRSGSQHLGQWIGEERDILRDYLKYVGGVPPLRITSIWLIANSVIQRGEGDAGFAGISIGDADPKSGRTRIF